jgi:hypothetical protein
MKLFLGFLLILASLIIGCKKTDSIKEVKSLAKAVFIEEIKRDSDSGSIWFSYEVVEAGIVHSFLGFEKGNQIHLSDLRFFRQSKNKKEEEIISRNDTVHRPTYLKKGLYKVKMSIPFRQENKVYNIVTDGNKVTLKW